jgi:hypothetical protein
VQEDSTKRPRETRDEIRDSRFETEPASQVSQARRLFDSRTPMLLKKRQAAAINTPQREKIHRSAWILPAATVRVPPYDRLNSSWSLDALVLYSTPDPATEPGACPCFANIAHRTSQLVRSVSLPEADAGDSAFSFSFSFSFVFSGVGCSRGHTGQDPDRPRTGPDKSCRLPSCNCSRAPSHGTTDPSWLLLCFLGLASNPNLPAIESHNKIRRRETKSPKRLLPS